jgi:hypothetical protein
VLRLLVAVGCASIGYSILLALDLVPATAVTAAGAFALIGVTLFSLAWEDPEWGPVPAPIAERESAPRPTVARHLHAIPVPHRPTAARFTPPAGPAPAPSFAPRPVSASISPGETLWARLTPATSGTLPVELVGPIAESAFANLPGEDYGPEGVGGPSSWEGAPLFDSPTPAWPSPDEDRSWSPTEDEAFNHTPPHLRPSPPALKEILGPRPGVVSPKPVDGTTCASCHRTLTNPPAWRACTTCHRPFCGECAFRARRNFGTGRCLKCRSAVEIEEARFVY